MIAATWPAAETQQLGPWRIRRGLGGGNRVSAASAHAPVTPDDLSQAADAMRALQQEVVFSILPGDPGADEVLANAGYVVRDETIVYACPTQALLYPAPPPVTAFTVWPPLALQRRIWAEGGIGPARLAVMDRVTGEKTTILGRIDDRPAGTLFVARHGSVAMLHALEIAPDHRRKGLARHLTRAAAAWAQGAGAQTFSLLTTVANDGARALYEGLGMREVGRYHYRVKPQEPS
ncbi:GNAT family N-acetyltransferase [Salipiger sp. IMCC34102]|uniref:GNAT family N-acetyltransferase n=1 Tax=Salipiger sp. IMCC34102 TaxID=2510647 RepID=UPI001F5DFA8F|nr:GNAT family N-acetyltransferase [Salipiger sp. IMCC34102]